MKLAGHLLACLVGALCAEAFTRATIEPDAMFEIAFSPGAKIPDETYGFLYTPGFRGYMRHPDKVWAAPLELEEHGYRPPARTPGAEDPLRVVIVSGRSMTMCYGLPQEDTLQEYMVRLSDRPLEVHNTGGAGIDPHRAWHFFQHGLLEELDFDVALFAVNPGDVTVYGTLPEDLETVPRHPDQDRFFYMLPSNIRMPKDALEEWLGPSYFRSYVVYGLLRYRQFPQRWLARARELVGSREEPEPPAGPPAEPLGDDLSPSAAAGARRAEELERGRAAFRRFYTHVERVLAARGTRLGLVFLPSILHPADTYEEFDRTLPERIPRIDLQRALIEDMPAEEFIGLGHFSRRHSEMVARELVRFVDELAPR